MFENSARIHASVARLYFHLPPSPGRLSGSRELAFASRTACTGAGRRLLRFVLGMVYPSECSHPIRVLPQSALQVVFLRSLIPLSKRSAYGRSNLCPTVSLWNPPLCRTESTYTAQPRKFQPSLSFTFVRKKKLKFSYCHPVPSLYSQSFTGVEAFFYGFVSSLEGGSAKMGCYEDYMAS